ncbi:MAG: glycosyltransferase [Ignavibacteria bacterium]
MEENKKIKIIFLGAYNTNEILPGPHKVAKRIFEQYSKTNKTVFINYFQDGKKYSLFQKLFGSNIIDEVNGSPVIIMGIITLMLYIIKWRPKIIHLLNYERFIIFAIFLKMILRFKLFYTVNGIIAHENKYYNTDTRITVMKNIIVEYLLINYSDLIFVLSGLSEVIIRNYYNVSKEKTIKTFNGIDDVFLDYRPINNEAIEKNSIVFIGDINRPQKGFASLIYVLEKFDIEVNLHVIDSKFRLESICCNNVNIKINCWDKFKPKELKEFLVNKSVIVCPSEYDPFNISVLESISCGLFPVITKQTGVVEHIEKNIECKTYNCNDIEKLYQILKCIIEDKDFKRVDNSAYLRSLTWQCVLEKYCDKYKLYI